MKERLTKLTKEAQERFIYAEEQAQYLIDNGVDCVKHGYWNYDGSCGVCKKQILSNYKNYCPHCGAKMDGATDNNVGDKGR